MGILIYGFGPYRQFRDNVTEKILRRLPRRSWLKRCVFPVRFDKKQFVAAVKANRPEIIVGLGQCSRGRTLRIETCALNRRRNSKKEKARPIVPQGRFRLRTDVGLDCGREGRLSNNPGDYVCNYSMYVIMDYLRRRRISTRFGFVHVPDRYNVQKAAGILLKGLERLRL
jgi:pyrrolidone-carboxylate peptidase